MSSTTPKAAPGGMDLAELIKTMTPTLSPTTMVFAHVPKGESPPPELVSAADMIFNEEEGMTLIIPENLAQQSNVRHEFACKKITLNVHSSLDAVGFLAAITTRLAASLNMGVNPVSGFFHDHLFVPLGKEDAVMDELKAMAAE